MQSTLQQLEWGGAVIRRTLPGRGRTARLELTEEGTRLLAEGRRVMVAADEHIRADVPPDQHRLLTDALFAAFVGARRRSGTSSSRSTTPGSG